MTSHRRLKIVGIFGICAILLTTLTMVGFAEDSDDYNDTDVQTDEDALQRDAEMYADHFGVNVETALRNLRLQKSAGKLQGKLYENEAGTYAGQWIQHVPEFKVIVQFTDDDSGRIEPYVADSPLEGLIEVRQAEFSMDELQQFAQPAIDTMSELDIEWAGDISVKENQVEIWVTDPQELETALSETGDELSPRVEVVAVDEIETDDTARTETASANAEMSFTQRALASQSEIYGGHWTSTCTSGFAVQHTSGTVGILTSGHCPDTQYHGGHLLPFQSQLHDGSYDVQWHTTPNHILRNLAMVNQPPPSLVTQDITDTVPRVSQSIDSWVCGFGSRTGYQTCGQIDSISHIAPPPNNVATWVRVRGEGLITNGDSGGPWYSGSDAYGVAKGYTSTYGTYMAIDFIEDISLSVLEWCPSQGC